MKTQLNNFDSNAFLQQYWQQKPLLIRNALANTKTLISPDELAGLACEPEMESRLVSCQNKQWQLRHGPFTAADFKQLPESHWTLLVQAVDHACPAIAELMEYFRFIPNWRLDDIMVSYAANGGSVGPHYDNYDVFLVQTRGKREWQLGPPCDEYSARLNHPELLLLANFECQQRYQLEAGDMLYIPPGISHWGIARDDDCITCSVGFRAPSVGDIVAEFSHYLADVISTSKRFKDLNPIAQSNPGEITHTAIEQLAKLIAETMDDPNALTSWFGEYMTQPKYAEENLIPLETATSLLEKLQAGLVASRDPASRFAYSIQPKHILLFVNGLSYQLDKKVLPLAELLCGQTSFEASELLQWIELAATQALLIELFSKGYVFFDDD